MASRRSKAHREALNEDVQAEEEEQERRAVLEEVATHLNLVLSILSAMIHTVYVTFHTRRNLKHLALLCSRTCWNTLKFLLVLAIKKKILWRTYPNFLKAVSVTSYINAQTAIIVSNRVFQPRIPKNRGNSYFSKTWKDVLWPLYFLKSRIRKEHVFCQPY